MAIYREIWNNSYENKIKLMVQLNYQRIAQEM